jgi:hypothetical protein
LTSSREGRDVVLAINLTESVGLNDERRLRLKQIIQDSLVPSDSVHIVPFASTANPLQPQVDSLSVLVGQKNLNEYKKGSYFRYPQLLETEFYFDRALN